MLSANIVVAQLQRLAQRQFQYLLGPRGERDVTGGSGLALPNKFLHLGTHRVQGNIHGLQRLRSHAFTLVDEAQQQVLTADVAVIQQPGFFLGKHNYATGAVSKSFKHLGSSFSAGMRGTPRCRQLTNYDATGRFRRFGPCSLGA